MLVAQGLTSVGLSAVQTGMDNVRNMTGSPIAGIDPHELIDVRQLNYGAPPVPRINVVSDVFASQATCILCALYLFLYKNNLEAHCFTFPAWWHCIY